MLHFRYLLQYNQLRLQLTSIKIPNSVTSIGYEAYRSCSSLTSITIPDSVTSIGNEAFAYCSSLTSVIIGNSVASIGVTLFSFCDNIQFNIYDNGKYLASQENPYFALIEVVKGVSTITIHNETKIIAAQAFAWSLVNTVEISDSVTFVGSGAFTQCSSLTIYCEVESQPSGWDVGWNYDNRPVIWCYVEQ